MTKATRWLGILGAIGVIGYIGVAGYVYYQDINRFPPSSSTPPTEHNAKVLTLLTQHGCDYCHISSSSLPFYANFPIMKTIMAHDIKLGSQFFDMAPLYESLEKGTPAPQSEMTKLEWVVEQDTMPPTRYNLLHWAGGLSQTDKKIILTWIKEQRIAHYADPKVPEAMRNEPIQPLPESLPVDSAKVALGMRLYHDPRLSIDNTVACVNCHKLGEGGIDGLQTSVGVDNQKGPINAPTVFNAAFNIKQFWDGRAADLQEQAGGPPLNPIEMASTSWEEIIGKLNQDPTFLQDFLAAYPEGLSDKTITRAIAEFEKTLLTPNSPFDRYLKGDSQALTAQQIHGYQLFKQNKCATCHVGKNMGGRSFEPLGLKHEFNFGTITEADLGRFNVTKDERDRFRQKVPTLRNVAITAPYFHRGDVLTLDDAVKQMLKYQIGVTLSQKDVDDIVAFLESLNGVYTPYPIQ